MGWRAAGILDNFFQLFTWKIICLNKINKTPFLRNCTYVKQHLKYNEDKTYYFFEKDPQRMGGGVPPSIWWINFEQLNLEILPMTMFSLMIKVFKCQLIHYVTFLTFIITTALFVALKKELQLNTSTNYLLIELLK